MSSELSSALGARARGVLAALRIEPLRHEHLDQPPPAAPFITISRQAGAGGQTLAQKLVDRLNQNGPEDRPWTSWDRELVERVSADHHISRELIDALEESHRTWISDFLSGLSFSTSSERPDEFAVYRRVVATVRALAQAGRVVLVGRGAVFVTRDMPGGIHVRIVAPLQDRIKLTMREQNMSEMAAAEWVRQVDHMREAFYRRYWPNHPLVPEMFTLTLNAGRLSEQQMADAITSVLKGARRVPVTGVKATI